MIGENIYFNRILSFSLLLYQKTHYLNEYILKVKSIRIDHVEPNSYSK
jgi:hypothetical protein